MYFAVYINILIYFGFNLDFLKYKICCISHIDTYIFIFICMFFKIHPAFLDVLGIYPFIPPNLGPRASNPRRRSNPSQGLAEGDAAGDATVTSSR